jgi:hypothetical protein
MAEFFVPPKPEVFLLSHNFCGQDCEQGPAHDSKCLILFRKPLPHKNLAAWLAELFPPNPAFPHIFCGKDCAQADRWGPKPLIPKRKLPALKN